MEKHYGGPSPRVSPFSVMLPAPGGFAPQHLELDRLHRLAYAARTSDRLPQLDGQLFLTDGGIETTLIFHEGLDLPLFAAFDLLKDAEGTDALRRYYEPYLELARERGLGFVLESPTWRANPDLGIEARLRRRRPRRSFYRKAIAQLVDIRATVRERRADRDQRLSARRTTATARGPS